MCELQIFAGPPIYHLSCSVMHIRYCWLCLYYIIVCINLQPKYELPSSTRFVQFRKFVKNELGHRPPQPLLRKKIMHGVQVLVLDYTWASEIDFPSSINFRDISGFRKLGANNSYYRSPQRVQSGTVGFYWYDFYKSLIVFEAVYLAPFPRCRLRYVQRCY